MFYLELVSGLRKGELVALQWSDLDEANCTISVSKQASWDTEGNLILSQPKTGNSIREVSIPQDAVELLKQEHAKHPSNPWMFPSSRTGEMYHPDSVVNLHKKILKDAGLEHIRFHDLRHPHHSADAAKGRRENGQFHGTDSIRPTGKQSTGKERVSSPVLFGSFRTVRCVGHGVGRAGVSRR